jgi:5-methylcytosine-specific restriction endonuclease McrA
MATTEPTHEILSRKDAKERGLKYYFTGKTCLRGHTALRRVATCVCRECEPTIQREWRSENIEWVRERDLAQKDKDRPKIRAQERARYAKNPQKYIEKQKRFYAENGDEVRRKRRVYHYEIYTDPDVRSRAVERSNQWAINNPERAKIGRSNARRQRRARETSSIGVHTSEDVAEIYKAQRGKCAYCRKKLKSKYDVDHVVPISKGGSNDRKNLQITCPTCNRQKGARDPIFHARMLGKLL